MQARLAKSEYLRSLGVAHYRRAPGSSVAGVLHSPIKLLILVDDSELNLAHEKMLHGMIKVLQIQPSDYVTIRLNNSDNPAKLLASYLPSLSPKYILQFKKNANIESSGLPIKIIEHPSLMENDIPKKKVAYQQLLVLARELKK